MRAAMRRRAACNSAYVRPTSKTWMNIEADRFTLCPHRRLRGFAGALPPEFLDDTLDFLMIAARREKVLPTVEIGGAGAPVAYLHPAQALSLSDFPHRHCHSAWRHGCAAWSVCDAPPPHRRPRYCRRRPNERLLGRSFVRQDRRSARAGREVPAISRAQYSAAPRAPRQYLRYLPIKDVSPHLAGRPRCRQRRGVRIKALHGLLA